MKRPLFLGSAVVVLAAALFGTLGYIARGADAAGVGAFAFTFWRGAIGGEILISATLLAAAAGRSRLPHPRLLVPRQRWLLLIALLSGVVLNLAVFIAYLRTEIAVVLIGFYTYPAMVTIAASRLYGERLDRPRVAALALAMGGLALVLLGPLIQTGRLTLDPLGVGLALLAALCQTLYLLIAGRGFAPFSSLHVATYVIAGAALISLPIALLFGPSADVTRPFSDLGAVPWVLAAGIAGAAIPTTALLVGMAIVGPGRASILMTFEPVVGVGLAALLLSEEPGIVQIIGGIAVLVAAVLLQQSPSAPHAAAEEEPGYQPLV